MTDLITLSGDYGYDSFKISGINSTEIDATGGHWIVANIGDDLNRYPFSVRDSADITVTGGTIDGEVPLDIDWVDAYVNSAAVYSRDVDNILIQSWTISQAWDAIRIVGDDGYEFTIDNVMISDVRDDAIENDDGLGGTISNSLFDGVFVGISLYDSGTNDQTDKVVTLDNVLIRMESFLYKGQLTHHSIFKVKEGLSPSLSIHGSVFAIEDVGHAGQKPMAIAWESVVSSSNNYFLNLSDTPLPDDYPLPPDGFTVLQGAAAREYWESARADWIAENRGVTVAEPTELVIDVDDGTILEGETVSDVAPAVQNANSPFTLAVETPGWSLDNGTLVRDAAPDYDELMGGLQSELVTLRVDEEDGDSATADVKIEIVNNPTDDTAAPEVTFHLYDAASDSLLTTIQDGDRIDPALIVGQPITIVAVPADPSTVSSIRFDFDYGATLQTENVAPYALFGDKSGDFAAGSIGGGAHTLTVTGYEQDRLGGSLAFTRTIQFSVAEPTELVIDVDDVAILEGETVSDVAPAVQNADSPFTLAVEIDDWVLLQATDTNFFLG